MASMAAAGEPLVPHRAFAMADGGGGQQTAEAPRGVDPRDTPLAAVVPSHRRGEPVPRWCEGARNWQESERETGRESGIKLALSQA